MGAAIFLPYSKHSDLSFASVQQTFAVNSRSVEQTDQTFNKTFAVFAQLDGPLLWVIKTISDSFLLMHLWRNLVGGLTPQNCRV